MADARHSSSSSSSSHMQAGGAKRPRLGSSAAVAPKPAAPPASGAARYSVLEASTNLRYAIVSNDGEEESLVRLVTLKEIFARQLPKMPREYIVRYVMDRQHRCLACVREESGEVVGGVCFRPFEPQRFAEIAFLAVDASHQVQKIGTRLMNQLKEYAKAVGLTHFLTFADNFAIGYFKKQGFSAAVTVPRERWHGYIKEYDGGTLMECFVHPEIDYAGIKDLVKRQRALVLARARDARLAEAGAAAAAAAAANGGTGKRAAATPTTHSFAAAVGAGSPFDVPGVQEAGWVPPLAVAEDAASQPPQRGVRVIPPAAAASGPAMAELQFALRGVVDQVAVHRDAWPFHEPVPASVVDYRDVVKEPVDLTLIRQRVDAEHYTSVAALRRDLQLMVDNCLLYNKPDTDFYKAALGLADVFPALFGEVAAPSGGGGAGAGAHAPASSAAAAPATPPPSSS